MLSLFALGSKLVLAPVRFLYSLQLSSQLGFLRFYTVLASFREAVCCHIPHRVGKRLKFDLARTFSSFSSLTVS